MPRTKSLAALIEHYGEERIYNPKAVAYTHLRAHET